mmetsp:Transcript_19059/g.31207  ORF Transcript_19059/g.31207 Transcript_19059/m.31207 type:complete len:106 (+) Transcript_19059:69-386(+)
MGTSEFGIVVLGNGGLVPPTGQLLTADACECITMHRWSSPSNMNRAPFTAHPGGEDVALYKRVIGRETVLFPIGFPKLFRYWVTIRLGWQELYNRFALCAKVFIN